jgi:hypothetical protein
MAGYGGAPTFASAGMSPSHVLVCVTCVCVAGGWGGLKAVCSYHRYGRLQRCPHLCVGWHELTTYPCGVMCVCVCVCVCVWL